jgi:hypothetical protein
VNHCFSVSLESLSLILQLQLAVLALTTLKNDFLPRKCESKEEHPKVNKRHSSVGIATDYGMDDRMTGDRIPAGAVNFSLRHRVQTGSEVHLASWPTGTRDSFPGGKAAGA